MKPGAGADPRRAAAPLDGRLITEAVLLMARRDRRHPDSVTGTGTSRIVPLPAGSTPTRTAAGTGCGRVRPGGLTRADRRSGPVAATAGPRRTRPARAGPGQLDLPELAAHRYETRGIRIGESALPAFGDRHGICPYRPASKFLRGGPARQTNAREQIVEPNKGAAVGGLVLALQDEARFPMIPTATPGSSGSASTRPA